MPTLACAMAGIYGYGAHESIHRNIKTRHCISGCGRVVPSGLWLDALLSYERRRRRNGGAPVLQELRRRELSYLGGWH
jgi:hypothetical protein